MKNQQGFTIFFAMLVGGLALAVGFAIYDLAVREVELSAAATQSQFAIYAADAGVECALYWDNKYGPTNAGSAFGTSTEAVWATAANCNGQNIVAAGTPPNPVEAPPTGWSTWDNTSQVTASEATTTFTLSFLQTGQPYCAVVSVGKSTVLGVLYTNVVSKGYNNCGASGTARLERALRVSY